jgi:subtilisin family serine protease
LVVNSAGNEGSGPWHYIGTPADAPGVFTVAAVRPNGSRANFSSWGPTPDGRIKPDVAAQGRFTVVPDINKYDVSRTNGTSFSSPVMAGMVASLRGAFPEVSSEALKQVIRQSSTQANEPDSSLGYGIPNFFFAYTMLLDASVIITKGNEMYYTPKPINDQLHIFVERNLPSPVKITLYNTLMQEQVVLETRAEGRSIEEIRVPNLESYPPGVYLLKIDLGAQPLWLEMVKE